MQVEGSEYFLVRRGRRNKLIGIGFLLKSADDLPEDRRGLAVSTYGKVIKQGWDWLGVVPSHPTRLTGVVEVPELVECLTTNKADFLRDPASLQKYYGCRKAIQDALSAILGELGETRAAESRPDRTIEKLQKEIDKVVGSILPDFPELDPLFRRKKPGIPSPALVADPDGDTGAEPADGTDVSGGDRGGSGEGDGTEGAVNGALEGTHLEDVTAGAERARCYVARRRRPGLMIGFDSETGGDTLGWLRGETLFVNAAHPAYERLKGGASIGVYITFVVGAVLSAHVQEGKAPLDFIQRFMTAWGAI